MQNSDRFLRATLKHLRYYIVPSLIDESPDRIILHGGFNGINNKNSTPGKIAYQIADMAILRRDYGVNDILISAMICNRGNFLNGKVKRVNVLLKQICEEYGYFFIDNSNIEIKDLWTDGIHLVESGKTKLAENFIIFFKQFFLAIFSRLFFRRPHTRKYSTYTLNY